MQYLRKHRNPDTGNTCQVVVCSSNSTSLMTVCKEEAREKEHVP